MFKDKFGMVDIAENSITRVPDIKLMAHKNSVIIFSELEWKHFLRYEVVITARQTFIESSPI